MASTRSVGPDARLPGAAHALAHAPQELGQDHARVAPGPHEGAVADGLADLGQAGAGRDAVELGDHGLEGQGHVGAGVAVGHRIDVQAVDVGLVEPEGVAVAPHHGAQVVGAAGSPGRSWQGMLTFGPF